MNYNFNYEKKSQIYFKSLSIFFVTFFERKCWLELVGSGNCITFAPALVPAGLRKVLGNDTQPPQGQLFKLQD